MDDMESANGNNSWFGKRRVNVGQPPTKASVGAGRIGTAGRKGKDKRKEDGLSGLMQVRLEGIEGYGSFGAAAAAEVDGGTSPGVSLAEPPTAISADPLRSIVHRKSVPVLTPVSSFTAGTAPLPVPSVHTSSTSRRFICTHSYEPKLADEIAVRERDVVVVSVEYKDGWARGTNETLNVTGMFPMFALEGDEESNA
ncbi:hypothetical protein HK101_004442 [Irineochytrium annulatum]|nr:hypothetical protein HK101_004442 [Irineochytrium annulatum]